MLEQVECNKHFVRSIYLHIYFCFVLFSVKIIFNKSKDILAKIALLYDNKYCLA